jgi:hypothetical protein
MRKTHVKVATTGNITAAAESLTSVEVGELGFFWFGSGSSVDKSEEGEEEGGRELHDGGSMMVR